MKYQNVILYIESLIKKGELSSGSRLPSVRILAKELGCSKSTVTKSYELLVQNKLAYSIEKSGFYMMNDPQERLMSNRIELSRVRCSDGIVKKNELQQLLNKSFDQHLTFADQDIEGFYPLREKLKHYFKVRKIFAGTHDIFIMPSFVQCVAAILSINGLNNGIVVEDPIDKDLVNLFKRKKNIHLLSRELSIDLNLLELLFIKEEIQVLLITSHIHIPTGVSLDLIEKKQLLELCGRYDVKIIEINHFEEAFSYEESQSLFALDKQDIVFHIKTFNHVISTHINLVALIVPKAYTSKVKYYKETMLGYTTVFEQLLLTQYFESNGTPTQFIRKQEQNFSVLVDLMKDFGNFDVSFTDAPLFALVKVPFHFNLETMVLELERQNIVIESLKDYFIKEHTFKGFIISINSVSNHELHLGLQRIKNAINII
ncbi:MAG: PLP-dependent aminotransferase family protein [Clostridiales bacterium]|nr:PLP-dependent aminotransferase family protein [Clostridiales bacterium]